MRDSPIKCVKYNHALDADIQNYLQFESNITVSEDGRELIITNKKPRDNADLVLEADPNQVKIKQREFQHSVKKNKQLIKKSVKNMK